jgi:hypothetical protein
MATISRLNSILQSNDCKCNIHGFIFFLKFTLIQVYSHLDFDVSESKTISTHIEKLDEFMVWIGSHLRISLNSLNKFNFT